MKGTVSVTGGAAWSKARMVKTKKLGEGKEISAAPTQRKPLEVLTLGRLYSGSRGLYIARLDAPY